MLRVQVDVNRKAENILVKIEQHLQPHLGYLQTLTQDKITRIKTSYRCLQRQSE